MTLSYPSSRCRQRSVANASSPATGASCGAPGASLLQSIDGLMQQLGQLQALLVGEPPQAEQPPTTPPDPQSTAGSHPEDPECPFGPDYDSTWDAPWDELSVVELRSLLRCYPIDRRSLPAPIEGLRRDELIAALHQLQPLHP